MKHSNFFIIVLTLMSLVLMHSSPACAQIMGHPVLNRDMLSSIQPDFHQMLAKGELSQALVEDAIKIAIHEAPVSERLAACQRLLAEPTIDFPTRRWTAMHLVFVYAEQNDAQDLEAFALNWLSMWPDERQYLPEEWRIDHPVEPRMNIYLRGYLAHCYLRVVNENFNWSAEERNRKFREILDGALTESSEPSIDVVNARLYLAKGLLPVTLPAIVRSHQETCEGDATAARTSQIQLYSAEKEVHEKCAHHCGQVVAELQLLASDELLMLENGLNPDQVTSMIERTTVWQAGEQDEVRRLSDMISSVEQEAFVALDNLIDNTWSALIE